MKLSIIIPIYNEAAHINELLFYIRTHLKQPEECEIILVDGGSTDNTLATLEKEENIVLIKSSKGRGRQMNVGSKEAKGNVLYFLHADSFPPKHFDEMILEEISKGNYAGCFKMKFRSNHWWLWLAGWFTQFNVKFFRGGDQSLFIIKQWFQELGTYPEEVPIMEDCIFIRSIYEKKKFKVIQHSISTSARRYRDNGVGRLQFHYWMIYIKRWFGATPSDLFKYYKTHVK